MKVNKCIYKINYKLRKNGLHTLSSPIDSPFCPLGPGGPYNINVILVQLYDYLCSYVNQDCNEYQLLVSTYLDASVN